MIKINPKLCTVTRMGYKYLNLTKIEVLTNFGAQFEKLNMFTVPELRKNIFEFCKIYNTND